MAPRITQGHGFVWPDGLPNCIQCGRMPNDRIHVTPSPARTTYPFRAVAAAADPGSRLPVQPHAYRLAAASIIDSVLCQYCGQPLKSSVHLIGAPAGVLVQGRRGAGVFPEPPTLASAEERTVVVEGDRLVLATRVASVVDPTAELEALGREMASTDSPHLWISGRYVGADAPNRNAAYWSSGDLEMGQPTVAHGPVNWLHEERHVIGAIAASRLVAREAADDQGLGTHIAALGAVWPWLYPDEANLIRQASDAGSLWFSMECISREVACLAEGCGNAPAYRPYMLERETARCEHMKAGGPRRFVDPVFQGVGIIVPPVRPGWALADARVTAAESEQLVERQAAAFEGLQDEEAAVVASRILDSSCG